MELKKKIYIYCGDMMAEVVEIEPEHRLLIEPVLVDMLPEEALVYVDDMFEEVVYTYPNGVPLVTLKPYADVDDLPAMQFSTVTGEFVELTEWDYIQTVDTDAQQEEAEAREEVEGISLALKHYLKTEYHLICDFEKIITNRTALTIDGTACYKYECPGQTIYLDTNHYAVTYDKQVVVDDTYYYDFDGDINTDSGEVSLVRYNVPLEWKRTTIWG